MKFSNFLILFSFISTAFAAPETTKTPETPEWKDYIQTSQMDRESTGTAFQNRQIEKESRLQLLGGFALLDRNDLYFNPTFTLAGRYHFSEKHALELSRFYFSSPSATSFQKEVILNANYTTDVQINGFLLISSPRFTENTRGMKNPPSILISS
jgi:hypothetical protein